MPQLVRVHEGNTLTAHMLHVKSLVCHQNLMPLRIFKSLKHCSVCYNTHIFQVAGKIKEFFHREGIHSTTIQPEFGDMQCSTPTASASSSDAQLQQHQLLLQQQQQQQQSQQQMQQPQDCALSCPLESPSCHSSKCCPTTPAQTKSTQNTPTSNRRTEVRFNVINNTAVIDAF